MMTNMCTGMAHRSLPRLCCCACPEFDKFKCRRRIAKATGGQVVMALADMDGNETFEASNLGTAEEVGSSSQILVPLGCVRLAMSVQHQG